MIELKKDYPKSPPYLGFNTEFPFNMGAAMKIYTKGPLEGLWTICLNIIGNFSDFHKEWQTQQGEGWSPSMSIKSLLVQLQSTLIDLDKTMNDG